MEQKNYRSACNYFLFNYSILGRNYFKTRTLRNRTFSIASKICSYICHLMSWVGFSWRRCYDSKTTFEWSSSRNHVFIFNIDFHIHSVPSCWNNFLIYSSSWNWFLLKLWIMIFQIDINIPRIYEKGFVAGSACLIYKKVEFVDIPTNHTIHYTK